MSRPTRISEDEALAKFLVVAVKVSEVTVDARDILEYVAENFDPEDVFDTEALEAWAEHNGYTKAG
jgi:hypothetical protein